MQPGMATKGGGVHDAPRCQGGESCAIDWVRGGRFGQFVVLLLLLLLLLLWWLLLLFLLLLLLLLPLLLLHQSSNPGTCGSGMLCFGDSGS